MEYSEGYILSGIVESAVEQGCSELFTKCKFLCLTVRPNKPQHWCLEQGKLYCMAKQGECVANAQILNSLMVFRKKFYRQNLG